MSFSFYALDQSTSDQWALVKRSVSFFTNYEGDVQVMTEVVLTALDATSATIMLDNLSQESTVLRFGESIISVFSSQHSVSYYIGGVSHSGEVDQYGFARSVNDAIRCAYQLASSRKCQSIFSKRLFPQANIPLDR